MSMKELMGRRVKYNSASEFHNEKELPNKTCGTIVESSGSLRTRNHFEVEWDNGYVYNLYLKEDIPHVLMLLPAIPALWMDTWLKRGGTT